VLLNENDVLIALLKPVAWAKGFNQQSIFIIFEYSSLNLQIGLILNK